MVLFFVLIFSNAVISQDINYFKERIIASSTQCKTIIVDMKTGELKVVVGDLFHIICEPTKKLKMGCSFLDTQNKIYVTKGLEGGMIGSEGVLSSDSDEFIFNGVTRKYISETRILLSDNRIRGKKICTGNWLYESEIKNKGRNGN